MKRIAGSLAKVTAPRLFKVTHRKRLFELLDSYGNNRPITWITGPAGSGKTSLISSYLDQLGLPCLWYQLDAGDADPASFFYYLGLAAQKAAPRLNSPFPLLTPEYFPGLSVFSLRFFETLFNRLDLPVALVFDNYQDVAEDAPTHELLRQGFEHLPQGVRIFLASRTHPPPVMARLRANSKVSLVQWKDLKLTMEEAADIVSIRFARDPHHQILPTLYEQTDGWVAGLILMMEAVHSASVTIQPLHPGINTDVFDYFSSEVFDKSSRELQAILLKTAFLPEFSAETVRALTGSAFNRAILSTFYRKSFFVTRYVHKNTFYRYHSLFREFLMAKARETLSEEALRTLLLASANALEKSGEIEAAVELWFETETWEAIIKLVMVHGKDLLEQGRFQVVASWLQRLPENQVKNNPWLLFFKSLCSFPVEPFKSGETAWKAYQKFKEQGDVVGKFMAWAAAVEGICYSLDSYKILDDWIAEFKSLKTEYDSLAIKEIKASVASCAVAALSFRQPGHPDLPAWIDKAFSFSGELSDVKAQIRMWMSIIWYHISYTGNMYKAGEYLTEMQQSIRNQPLPTLSQILVNWVESMVYLFSARRQQALAAAMEGLERSRKSGMIVLNISLLGQMAIGHLDTGNVREAAEQLKIFKKKNLGLYELFMLNYTESRLFLLKNNPRRANEAVERMSKLAEPLGVWFCKAIVQLQKARLACAVGDHRGAMAHIRQAIQYTQETQSSHFKAQTLFYRAHIEFKLGDERSGIESLRQALQLARELGLMFCFWDLPTDTADLCVRAAEEGIEVEHVREIVTRRGLVPEKAPVHIMDWPWAIKIFTMNTFRIVRGEEAMRFGRKPPQKTLELLKLIIALGSDGGLETTITDLLWPNADGDNANYSLKTTLYRLRKLLDHSGALVKKGRRLILDRHHVWTDLWAFEELYLNIIPKNIESSDASQRNEWVRNCETALALYKEAFLAHETWAPQLIAKREQVRGCFIHIVKILGRHWEASGQLSRAVDLYEMAISKEAGVESLYGWLMHCYLGLHRKAEAIATYNRCRSTLSAILGVRPSEKIEQLYCRAKS